MPKASFVAPVKNGEKVVEETIQSLRNQTISDIEIIIVNDHSEDGTLEILNRLATEDSRIKVLNQADKTGVSAARNAGTRAANSNVILPTDIDDPNYPERAEVSIRELAENGAGVFYSNLMRYFPETGEKVLRHFQPFDQKLLGMINFIAHAGSSAYKKEVFEAIGGYDEEVAIGEDWDLWLSAAEKGFKFCYKNIPLAIYTMHAGQITGVAPDPEKIRKRQEWNRIVRQKHDIFEIDPEYVKKTATTEVIDFYINKNYEIWFGEESIPKR